MSTCSCKKEEKDICNVIDCLGKVVENIDCNKKASKEIDKAVKKVKEETEAAIKAAKEEWAALLKKFNSEKWVVGEYKWMPVGSRMPEGWTKVDLPKGLTLVQGSELGETTGEVKKHRHSFPNDRNVWLFDKGSMFFMNRPAGETTAEHYIPFTKEFEENAVSGHTAYEGTDKNLAAGKFAELWQYKGIDYKKKCMAKCLGSYFDECLDKCTEE